MAKLLIGVVVLLTSGAWAQNAQGERQGQTSTRTELRFDEDVVEGASLAPDLAEVTYSRRPGQGQLIKVREDFRDRVMHSASEL